MTDSRSPTDVSHADASEEGHVVARPAPDYAAANLARAIRDRRIGAAVVLLISLSVLAVAMYVRPHPSGYGTHRQLGLAACGSIGSTGLPCPTCGMTTAFAHTVRLQWWRALLAQPSGFLLALAMLAAVPGALYVLIRGEYPPLAYPTVTPFRLVVFLLIWFVGGWAFKLAHGLATGALPVR